MATRPCRALRYLSAWVRSRLFARKELVGFLFGGVDRCEQLVHGLAVGRLVGLELLANLLAQTPDRFAVRLEFRSQKRGGRRLLGELMNAHRDRGRGGLEGDVANRLAADLGLGSLQGLGVDPGVVDLVEGHVECVAAQDIGTLGVVAQPLLNLGHILECSCSDRGPAVPRGCDWHSSAIRRHTGSTA